MAVGFPCGFSNFWQLDSCRQENRTGCESACSSTGGGGEIVLLIMLSQSGDHCC